MIMNRELRKLSITAQQIGHCLLCGGVNGVCTCSTDPRIESAPVKREFIDLCKGESTASPSDAGNADYVICTGCGSICAYLRVDSFVRCECGYVLKEQYEKPVIQEPDYSVLDGISELPAHARALKSPSRKVRNVSTRRYQK